jgi:fibronectin type 3 domain-containing protein
LSAALALIGEAPEAEYRDANFEWGHTYYYTVRAAAHVGADVVESTDPKPVVISAKDVFPPAAPTGVEAVVIPATPGVPAYVELAWGISPEADLAGYVVYRSEQPDTQGTRLNAELLPAPTLRDISVEPGRRYSYRVTAVDRSGNESPASAVVMAEVPGR